MEHPQNPDQFEELVEKIFSISSMNWEARRFSQLSK